MAERIERWDVFELTLEGPDDGNPFVDVTLSARFELGHRSVEVAGFYDGDGTYRVRFMPDTPGDWRYVTHSNRPELEGRRGAFTCTDASADNHGPVEVRSGHHFAYADGTRFVPVGTTCYGWNHQPAALREQTLAVLRDAPFNKLRMCVFPKWYAYNRREPDPHPMHRLSDDAPDPARFNPAFFRGLDRCVAQLRDLGVEADLILFHDYDKWGYSTMDAEADDRYLRYVVARYAAYRNVWWSLANEYDLMKAKTPADWDRFFKVVQAADPHQHLRSVHNCRGFYDHAKPWVTHASIQHSEVHRVREWRELYGKPVIVDECCYEGDIPNSWGNIPARELVHRFWEVVARGGYATHGETYLNPDGVLWWSHGGTLHGESPARLAFLRDILEAAPGDGLDPIDGVVGRPYPCAGVPGRYYLVYFRMHQPAELPVVLPDIGRFAIDLIDTWHMRITPIPGEHSGETTVPLPARPYMALRVRALA